MLSVCCIVRKEPIYIGKAAAMRGKVTYFFHIRNFFPAFFLRWVLLIPTAKITLMWVDVLLSFGFFSV